MKNKSLLIATVFAASAMTVSAQDLTSKKGETILPEAGDWAISFDAKPFLNYAGQLFSNAGATSPSVGYTNGYPWSIKGKMFKDATTAYRAGIRLGFGSKKWANDITQAYDLTSTPPTYPNERPQVEDQYKAGYNGIVLTGGLELRRGKTRLQGYYGGELIFGMMGNKDAFTYGNNLFSGAQTATSAFADASSSYNTDWTAMGATANSNLVTDDGFGNPARITERKTSMMMFGLRGFIGVEYFILPKISIGAEYGWGLGFTSTKTTSTWESNDQSATPGTWVVGSFDDETKSSGFAIDSDIQNNQTGSGLFGGTGSLNIIFHF